MSFFIFFFSLNAFAVDCSNPPYPSDGRVGPGWWREYSSWCSACGGTPYQDSSGGGCKPGANWGGGSGSASSGAGTDGWIGSGLPMGDQIMLNMTNQVLQQGMKELFRAPTPEEQEAARLRRVQEEQARIAAELERQRLIKEKNDRMDAEASSTLGLLDSPKTAAISDEDLLKEAPKAKPACSEIDKKIASYDEGVKRLDINIGKTRKLIKQAEDGKVKADKELGTIAGEVVAGKMADKMADFAKNVKTIEKMKAQLKSLHGKPVDADTAKLQSWIENGIKSGNGVLDAYEKAKAAKEFSFSDPKNAKFSEQMMTALSEFNSGFMADTGAWEMAGETLSEALGPAGPVVFKASVLGIKVAANRGDKMISENDLNEQKYNLGNMMKTRAEMAQKAKDLKSGRTGCVE